MSLRIKVKEAIPAGDYAAPIELIPYLEGMTSAQFDQFIKGVAVDARVADEPVDEVSSTDHSFKAEDTQTIVGASGEFFAYFRYSETSPWKRFGRDHVDESRIGYLPSQMGDMGMSSTSSSSSSSAAPRAQATKVVAPRAPMATEAMLRSKHWAATEAMIQSSSGVPIEYAAEMAKVKWEELGGADTYNYMGTDRSVGPSEQRAAMRYIISKVGSVDDAKMLVMMKKAGRVPSEGILKLAVIKVSYKMIEFILPEDSLAKRGGAFMPYIREAFLAIKAKRELSFDDASDFIPAFIGNKQVDGQPKSPADQLKARQAFHVNHFRFLKGIFTDTFVARVQFTE